jgi:hypothetical protein
LVLTDIATGWTECAPLLVREQRLLTEVLGELRKLLLEPSVPHKKQPFLAAPVRSPQFAFRNKNGSFVPGTDGSNPSPSSSQSVSAVPLAAVSEKPRTLAAVCG